MRPRIYYSIEECGENELNCRGYGHRWDRAAKFGQRTPLWGTRHSLRCDQCSSWRHDLMNSRGVLDPSARGYELADEYQFAAQFSRQEARAELLRRDRRRERAGRRPNLELVS